MNFYKHHIGDYDADTSHLSWSEDMAYTRLMRLYYRREQPIPAEVGQACRLVRAASKQERDAVESVLREFFELGVDGWRNKRCDEEIAAAIRKSDANRINGKGGGRPPNSVSETEPKINPLGSGSVSKETDTKPTGNLLQTPDSRLQTPQLGKEARAVARPPPAEFDLSSISGLDRDAWKLWIDHRKAKKKPIRPQSMRVAAEEMAKLGTQQLAEVRRAIAGDWQGLHPAQGNGHSGGRELTKFERVTAHLPKEDQGFG